MARRNGVCAGTVLRGSVPGGTDLSICSASSNVERRMSIRVPRIGTRLDDRRGPRHAKLKTRAAWTDPSLCAVGAD